MSGITPDDEFIELIELIVCVLPSCGVMSGDDDVIV